GRPDYWQGYQRGGIDRIINLSSQDFVETYLRTNTPVIVEHAMDSWRALSAWNPQFFRDEFGEQPTQLYDDLFFMVSIRPLKQYVDRYVNRQATPMTPESAGRKIPYVRWYSRQNARANMPWSNDVFKHLESDWSCPGFFPTTDCYCRSRAEPRSKIR